jgi:AraC-like DNA-binding protein
MSTDALSEVFRAVRLGGVLFFSVEARGPWVAETPGASQVAHRVLPGADHVIEYHVITEGTCWAALVGGQSVQLEKGDVVVFPHGDPHVMSSAPGMRGKTEMSVFDRPGTLPVFLEIGSGSDRRTHVLCGFLGCDAAPFNPLLATLPRLLIVRRGAHEDGMLEHLVGVVIAESTAKRAGSEGVLARLSELMFIEVVRRHIASLPPENTGWLAGLRDPHVGRALGKLHDRPAEPWTLEDLARQVGVSRSMLAERFTHFVGAPPMQYLSQWRMQLAANLLVSGNAGLAEIAAAVGYGSEAAFSRAFKRLSGVAPAVWREQRKNGPSRGPSPEESAPSAAEPRSW